MSTPAIPSGEIEIKDPAFKFIKERARILLLLDSAERAGVAPLTASRLHALAYLADVLSPVWGLKPFDGKILKIEGGPHYPDIQSQVDELVILGLVNVKNLHYVDRPDGGARIDGLYELSFTSIHLEPILRALGAGAQGDAIDPRDCRAHRFLIDLAGALATLPDDEIDKAATFDATYANEIIGESNIVDFSKQIEAEFPINRSVAVTERFQHFLPQDSSLTSGEKLYLYAAYLGKRMHG
mgnify:CR=1 FL=1